MNLSLSAVTGRLLASYREGHRLALLFDYDGTLVPIVAHPELAMLDGKTRKLLDDLARMPRICIGIISGRALDELQEIVGLESLCYAGVCGFELNLRGTRFVFPGANTALIPIKQVAEQLEALLTEFPHAWLEHKGFGLTVHYRDVDVNLISDLCCRVFRTLLITSPPMRTIEAPMALEILPDFDCHKGTAVRAMIQHSCARGEDSLYAGDGANDQEAFEAVASMGGIALSVGTQVSRSAQCRIDRPEQTIEFLSYLRNQLASASDSC